MAFLASVVTLEDYPNYFNHQLPDDVGCATACNVAHTTNAFKRFCPRQFYITQVEPYTSITFPFCRWVVKYQLGNNGVIPESGPDLKRLFRTLKGRKPTNVSLIDPNISNGPPKTFVLEYGVDTCLCPRPDFDGPLQKPAEFTENGIKLDSGNLIS